MAGVWFHFCSAAVAAGSAGSESERLAVVLKASNILASDSKLLNVYATGKRVTVMVQRNEIADDRTSKIDSMFVARTLFNAFPTEIGDVRVLFSSKQRNEGRVVSVSANLVRDFSAGKITPDALLAQLNVEALQTETAPEVVQGPCEDRRLLIWQRIKDLQNGGTGVRPFLTLFQEIETKVNSANRNELLVALGDLEDKLSEQEEQVQLARKAAAGRGVVSSKTKSGKVEARIPASEPIKTSHSTAPGTASGTSGGAGLSPGVISGIRPDGSDGGTTSGNNNGASSSKTPSIAGVPLWEIIDSPPRFMELACSELEQRRDSEAQKYRERKCRIEEIYRSGDFRKTMSDFADFKADYLRKMNLPTSVSRPVSQSTLWGMR